MLLFWYRGIKDPDLGSDMIIIWGLFHLTICMYVCMYYFEG